MNSILETEMRISKAKEELVKDVSKAKGKTCTTKQDEQVASYGSKTTSHGSVDPATEIFMTIPPRQDWRGGL